MKVKMLFPLALALAASPVLLLRAQTRDPHGPLAIECAECHTAERWTPVDRPPTFRHDRTGFILVDAHARVACSGCHRSLIFNHVGIACADCHKDPHRGELGARCEGCHAARTWSNQRQVTAAHNRTRFPLFAVHANVDCDSCHGRQKPFEYSTTPTDCGACHAETYARTTNPNHSQAGFPRQCEGCHRLTSTRWSDASFRHDSFVLRGVHLQATCASCHVGGQYRGASRDCVGCHRQDYERTTNPNHQTGGFPTTCQSCHTEAAWRPASGVDHSQTRFPLTGAHGGVPCARCHLGDRYAGTPTDCYSCHETNYRGVQNPNHVAGNFPRECQNCHATTAWKPASSIDHSRTRFPLTGVHVATPCAQCHVGGRYTGTPTACYSCHEARYRSVQNPNHVTGNFSHECQTCHTTSAWKPANFNHNQTRFPLTGAHSATACARCHLGGVYAGTSTACYSCHRANYDATSNPNHRTSNFPTTCETCHTASAWRPANFNHSQTRFPLTGAHASTPCTRCHANGVYTGTPTACYSCHRANYDATSNPNHRTSNFPTTCQTCHTTSAWRPATFNHNQTSFPLTGAHVSTPCTRCHVNGVYTGTPTACYSCHRANYDATSNPNHRAAAFPTQCESCHTTSAWRPANWDHDGRYFPIYSGRHRGKWSTCADCHLSAGNYAVFECILCHEHSNKPSVDNDHRGVSGYHYDSPSCYRCHPRGNAG